MSTDRQRKKWTKEEKSYLSSSWGRVKVENIAKKLKRSRKAIINQANYMGLGTQMRWYSSSEVASILGISDSTIKRYINSGKLNYTQDKTKRRRRMCSEDDIRSFMRNYQDLWDTRKVTINLYSISQPWLEEKKERDKQRPLHRNEYYTETETKILIDRYRRGWSISEIAKELSRNEKSVYNRLSKVDFGRGYNF